MLVGLVLVALVLAAWWRRPVPLAALSVLWLVVNEPMEGAVLFSVTDTRGLTAADLTGLAGLALAASRLMLRTSGSTGGGDT